MLGQEGVKTMITLNSIEFAAPEALRPDIQKVFDAYYRVVYGSSAVSAEENELAASVREQLHAAAKKRLKQ